jgi:FixJ family two-component response regulator
MAAIHEMRTDMQGIVLIVDDDAGVRETLRLVLAREGYGILTASDGRTAIDLMATDESAGKVCVILCDLEMPNLGGKALIGHFRRQFPDIPIIVLSGATDTVYLEGIVQEGVGDWLRKPVTREALLEKVRTASNLFSLRQQHR